MDVLQPTVDDDGLNVGLVLALAGLEAHDDPSGLLEPAYSRQSPGELRALGDSYGVALPHVNPH